MNDNDTSQFKHLWKKTGLLIIGLVLLGLLASFLISALPHPFVKHYADPLKAGIILVIGGAISFVIERYIFRITVHKFGARKSASIRFVVRLLLYISIILAILAAFGKGISSIVFGGAFLTVIVGLAGQTMFGNLIAGLGLIIFHPFEVGDRITAVTWQYPILMPSYPHDALKPGYSGTITDINLMYTALLTDDGLPMTIPNGIIIQAAIENHDRAFGRKFRFRFDVDITMSPERFLADAQEILPKTGYHTDLRIVDVSPTTFSVAVIAETRQNAREDDVKTAIFRELIPLISEELTSQRNLPSH